MQNLKYKLALDLLKFKKTEKIGGKLKGYNRFFWKAVWHFLTKSNIHPACGPVAPEKWKDTPIQRLVQKQGKIFINRWIDVQYVYTVYSYSGILLNNKKKQTSDPHNKWTNLKGIMLREKPDRKQNTLCASRRTQFYHKQNLAVVLEVRTVVSLEDWHGGGMREISGMMEMFYTLVEVIVKWVYSFSKGFEPTVHSCICVITKIENKILLWFHIDLLMKPLSLTAKLLE